MKPAELYILNQPEKFQGIIYYVCGVIEKEFPEVDLLFKWKIPFYYFGKKPFCYINASDKKQMVDVAFFYGNQLKNNADYLNSEGRTLVKSLQYFTIESIPHEILLSVIQEAKLLYM
jgi:hypothetical protein